jgi:hypothetical protein
MKKQIFVMPAWMAGIQVRKDASGDIHVQPRFQRSMLE